MKSACITYILLLGGVLGTVSNSEVNSKEVDSLKIENGTNANIKSFPFDVAFLVANNIWGVGVILRNNWILTTAYNCIWLDPSYITIRAGSSYWTKNGKIFSAVECIIHPDYNGTWANDIALLKISGKISFNKNSNKAQLPSSTVTPGTQLTVSGWGVRSPAFEMGQQLQKSTQTIISDEECSKTYNLTGTNFCAYSVNSGPCWLDYGAPLTLKKTVMGLYQGSKNCTDPKTYPASYTNVFMFKNWISQTIKNNSATLDTAEDETNDNNSY